jgi:glyoxylase-like metal-dependent hydrolase (beta-lactamase superfamily II)
MTSIKAPAPDPDFMARRRTPFHADEARALYAVQGNSQKLDGGSMFGNAPKALWSRWIEPDELNRIPLACRTLLIRETRGKIILCETGIGAFFEPKMRERFGVQEEEHVLLSELKAHGLNPDDIDVIVLSHLHFDHAGGLLTAWREGAPLELAFPNAKLVIGEEAWARAHTPHSRDRASFVPELMALLDERYEQGAVELVPSPQAGHTAQSTTLGEGYRFHLSEGHTPGQLLIEVPTSKGALVFGGDLIPGAPWVHLPITMGYDRFPERLIDEKEALLSELVERGGWLFFTHDPAHATARLSRDDRGRFKAVLDA